MSQDWMSPSLGITRKASAVLWKGGIASCCWLLGCGWRAGSAAGRPAAAASDAGGTGVGHSWRWGGGGGGAVPVAKTAAALLPCLSRGQMIAIRCRRGSGPLRAWQHRVGVISVPAKAAGKASGPGADLQQSRANSRCPKVADRGEAR